MYNEFKVCWGMELLGNVGLLWPKPFGWVRSFNVVKDIERMVSGARGGGTCL